MARFRDSVPEAPNPERDDTAPAAGEALHDRAIGSFLSEARNLSAEQVERVLAHQRQHGGRFGEAAISLGLASADDVLFALAQQFHYPVAPADGRRFSPELVVLAQPYSPQAEVFRALRSQMMMRVFGDARTTPRALAIVSAEAGDGKTYVAANLAVALAQLGGRTLLVDADMRVPRQHEVFRLEPSAGLSAILAGRAERHLVQQVAGVRSLCVLPVGVVPPNPLELVERPAFAHLMRELLAKFDHVVVDTPALANGSDAQVIAARCGVALGVARRDVSRVSRLQELAALVGQASAEMLGFVVNEH